MAALLVTAAISRGGAGSDISQTVFARIAELTKPFLQDGVSDPLVGTAMPIRRSTR